MYCRACCDPSVWPRTQPLQGGVTAARRKCKVAVRMRSLLTACNDASGTPARHAVSRVARLTHEHKSFARCCVRAAVPGRGLESAVHRTPRRRQCGPCKMRPPTTPAAELSAHAQRAAVQVTRAAQLIMIRQAGQARLSAPCCCPCRRAASKIATAAMRAGPHGVPAERRGGLQGDEHHRCRGQDPCASHSAPDVARIAHAHLAPLHMPADETCAAFARPPNGAPHDTCCTLSDHAFRRRSASTWAPTTPMPPSSSSAPPRSWRRRDFSCTPSLSRVRSTFSALRTAAQSSTTSRCAWVPLATHPRTCALAPAAVCQNPRCRDESCARAECRRTLRCSRRASSASSRSSSPP